MRFYDSGLLFLVLVALGYVAAAVGLLWAGAA